MNSRKTKFCLARTEEYYYEESVNDESSDEEYSTIFRFIHQKALNRSQKNRITNHIQDVFNQQQICLDFTSDSLQTTSISNGSQHLNTSSFNRKKYDLVHNHVNYLKPVEPHKQRQSDILPIEQYERIMLGSPFDSPSESQVKVQRRPTVLPSFKPQIFNQSTQTSYHKSQNDFVFGGFDGHSSIYQQGIQQKTNKSFGTQTSNRSIHQELNSKSQNKSSNQSTNENMMFENSNKRCVQDSKINSTLKNSKMNSRSMQSKKNVSSQNKNNRLKDVSNLIKSQESKNNLQTQKRKSKSRFYDKTDFISFSKAQIFEPDDESIHQNHAQTELIESLMDSSTFKDLNSESSIKEKLSKESAKFSTQSHTKHFTGSFGDSTKSIHKSVNKSNTKSMMKSIDKSIAQIEQPEQLMIHQIHGKTIDDLSDVSLVLNSTCSQESTQNNKIIKNQSQEFDDFELDLSVIGFETSESDFEVVLDNESTESVEKQINSMSKLNGEIEFSRRSVTEHSSPELSIDRKSISETLSQPESIIKCSNQESEKENDLDISIEFNSEAEDEENNINKSLSERQKTQFVREQISMDNQNDQQMTSLRSTPKSILKKNSCSKRVWDASEFSLVNLTIGSSVNKSISAKKSSSVRFSDKVSEFVSNVSLKRNNPTKIESSDQSIDRSISKLISKSIDEAIDARKCERSLSDKLVSSSVNCNQSKTTENQKAKDSMPDLDTSYNDNLADKPEESDEESLNVTIDDLSMSLVNLSENEENDENTNGNRTPETKHQSTFTVKSLKKVTKKVSRNVATVVKKQPPKYYETFVDNTPTIIYPHHDETQETNVRRSSRVRPLDYWRNQQPKYMIDKATKCLTIEGIQKGLNVDNPFKRKRFNTNKSKKVMKKKNKKSKKRKCHTSEDETEEEQIVVKRVRYAPNENLSIHQQVNLSAIELSDKIKREASEYCAQKDLSWAESKQCKGVHIAFMNRRKDRQGNTEASGFMKLESLLQKPPQRSASYVTNYVVMFGAASVRINDQPNGTLDKVPRVILKSMEGFTVNQNALFSIENLREDELLLYFNVVKV